MIIDMREFCACLVFLTLINLTHQWPNIGDKLMFTKEHYVVTLKEDPKGAVLAMPEDSRMGIELPKNWRWKLSYSIVSGNQQKLFKVESKVVGDFNFLKVKTRLGSYINRESIDGFQLTILASVRQAKKYKDVNLIPTINNATCKVFVNVLDENDLAPLFSSNVYSIEVPETTPVHASIFKASATDADLGFNAEIFYGFTNPELVIHFVIHPTSGVISLVKELNFRKNSTFEISIYAKNRGFYKKGDEKINYAKVRILVVEANRFNPEIIIKTLLPCASKPRLGAVCTHLLVTDKDSDVNGFVDKVEITDEVAKQYFRIVPSSDGQSGEFIVEMVNIDYGEVAEHEINITIQATDSGRPPRNGYITIPFRLPTQNDKHILKPNITKLEIFECLPVKTPFLLFDTSVESFHFSITNNVESGKYFSISSRSGVLYLEKELDFEVMPEPFNLTIRISKQSSSKPSSNMFASSQLDDTSYLINITIETQDCNDNDPIFYQQHDEILIESNLPVNTTIYKANASDADVGSNGRIIYFLINEEDAPFSINPLNGFVHSTKPLDFKLENLFYLLIIKARDLGVPYTRENYFVLKIFSKGIRCTILGNSFNNSSSALTFPSINGNILRILGGDDDSCFHIHSNVLISSCPLPDHQQKILNIGNDDGLIYQVFVKFEDDDDDDSILSCLPLFDKIHEINKNISDDYLKDLKCNQNSNSPFFPDNQFFHFNIIENAPIGSEAFHIEADDTDCGYGGLVKYSITSGNTDDHFKIDPWSGALTIMRRLDRETTPQFALNVTVCDSGLPSRCQWKLYNFTIIDVNDNAPEFVDFTSDNPPTYRASVLESAGIGTEVLTVSAKDIDSDMNGRVEYKLLNTEFFDINKHSGEVVLRKPLDRESTSEMKFLVVASDCGMDQLSSTAEVVVNILDINDNIPHIQSFPIRVVEDLPVGSMVGTVLAVDQDSGSSGLVSYQFKDGGDGKFSIDSETGVISLLSELDFMSKRKYSIIVDAEDRGHPPLSSSSVVTIEVLPCPTNQNAPLFKDVAIRCKVKENQPSGTFVGQVSAVDADKNNYKSHFSDYDVSYDIIGGSGLSKFSIDKQGNIHTLEPLDREQSANYWLTIMASDQGQPPQRSKVEVYVKVTDVNDNAPHAEEMFYKVEIPENISVGTPIVFLKIRDPDDDDDDSSKGDDDDDYSSNRSDDDDGGDDVIKRSNRQGANLKINSGNSQGLFDVDHVTGAIITTRKVLDREKQTEHLLEISITDILNTSLSSKSYAIISVADVNDNTPTFVHSQHLQRPYVNIPSSLDFMRQLRQQNKTNNSNVNKHDARKITTMTPAIFRALASDADEGRNARLHYELDASNSRHVLETFRIESETGFIFPSINWIQPGSRFDVKIKVSDDGIPQLSNTDVVTMVSVHSHSRSAKNNNPPLFNDDVINSSHDVTESDLIGSIVFVAGATDLDGDQLWYFITGGNTDDSFSMNMENGCVVIATGLDHESIVNYTLTLMVTDGWHYDVTSVHIRVFDVNDNSPHFSPSHPLHITISNNSPIGTTIGRVEASDGDDNDERLQFSIINTKHSSSSEVFKINPITGEITTQKELRGEHVSEHHLLIMVRDQGLPIRRDFTQVFINVLRNNDHPPKFFPTNAYWVTLRPPSLLNGGDWVGKVQASDDDANGEIFYSIVSGNKYNMFEIDQSSGVVSINNNNNNFNFNNNFNADLSRLQLGTPPTNLTLHITAQDRETPPLVGVATLTVTFSTRHEECVMFEKDFYEFEVLESRPFGHFVGNVRISSNSGEVVYVMEDFNSTDNVGKHCSSDMRSELNNFDGNCDLHFFKIHPFTGVITTTKSFDFEKFSEYKLKVKAFGKSGQSAITSIIIKIIDTNDNNPTPMTFNLYGEIEESAGVGFPIRNSETGKPLRIEAVDSDATALNSHLHYDLVSPGRIPFEISPRTGVIKVSGSLDREAKSSFVLKVQVSDMGKPKLFHPRLVSVSISILDVNDNAPEFSMSNYKIEIPFSDFIPSMEIFMISAIDLDESSIINYSIVDDDDDDDHVSTHRNLFHIDQFSGMITTSEVEKVFEGSKSFVVSASDGEHEARARVEVVWINSSSPSSSSSSPPSSSLSSPTKCMSTSINVKENLNESQLAGVVDVITDEEHVMEKWEESGINYELLNYKHLFEVHPHTGVIRSRIGVAFDREDKAYYLLTTKVTHKVKPSHITTILCGVNITIEDDNDNAPEFDHDGGSYSVIIGDGGDDGDTISGGVIFKISAQDKDVGSNGLIHYEITGGDGMDQFKINSSTGEVTLRNGVVRLRHGGRMKLMVKASDNGNPSMSITTTTNILVSHSNAPVFQSPHFVFQVPNNSTRGSVVGVVRHVNQTRGHVIYDIVDDDDDDQRMAGNVGKVRETFGLNFMTSNPGNFCSIIVLTPLFNYGDDDDDDGVRGYNFTIRALDISNNITAVTRVTINIRDVERRLIQFHPPHHQTSVQSSTPPGSTILTMKAFNIRPNRINTLEINTTEINTSEIRYEIVEYSQCQGHKSGDVYKRDDKTHVGNDYHDTHESPDDSIIKNGYLSIDARSGEVKIKHLLYHLRRKQKTKLIQCIKAYQPLYADTRFAYATISINIETPSEFTTNEFNNDQFEADIDCDAPSSIFVKDLSVASPVDLTYDLIRVTNHIEEESDYYKDNILSIDKETGIVTLNLQVSLKRFCREVMPLKTSDQSESRHLSRADDFKRLTYNVTASNGTNLFQSKFHLDIKGRNSHSPILERVFYGAMVDGDVPPMSEIVRVDASDGDDDDYYGGVWFKITEVVELSQNEVSHLFMIEERTGIVRNKNLLTSLGIYRLTIRVEDGGGRSSEGMVEIEVVLPPTRHDFTMVDDGDLYLGGSGVLMAPFYFEEYKVVVPVEADVGTIVVQVLENDTLTWLSSRSSSSSSPGNKFCGLYSLLNCSDLCDEHFKVDSSLGNIIIRKSLQNIANQFLSFIIQFTDCNNNNLTFDSKVQIFISPPSLELPRFEKSSFLFFVDEDRPLDWVVATIRAHHPTHRLIHTIVQSYASKGAIGSGMNQSKLRNNNATSRMSSSLNLEVDPNLGVIKISGNGLDRESSDTLDIFMRAQSLDDPRLVSKVIKVTIKVLDVNDNIPSFDSSRYSASISENMPRGTPVVRVGATDPDLGNNGDLTYFLMWKKDFEKLNISGQGFSSWRDINNSWEIPFSIDEKSGWITSRDEIDGEMVKLFELVVVACDGGVSKKFSWTEVVVRVDDVNDNEPRFELETFQVRLSRNTSTSNNSLLLLSAFDPDTDSNLTYGILSGNVNGIFTINGSGHLLLRGQLDREKNESYKMEVVISDGRHVAKTFVVVDVDVDVVAPVCTQISPISIPENLPTRSQIFKFSASDGGRSKKSFEIFYSLDGRNTETFLINSSTGILYLATPLDREKQEVYNVVVKATIDNNLSCERQLVIFVEDVNDNAPKFTRPNYSSFVVENGHTPVILGQVTALDDDLRRNGIVRYSIIDVSNEGMNLFSIHDSSGSVILNTPLDRETHESYVLNIIAYDLGTPSLTSTVEFLVDVINTNDNPPTFSQSFYHFSLSEQTPIDAKVGGVVARKDGSSLVEEGVTYDLLCDDLILAANPGCQYFSIDSRSGTITIRKELDFESTPALTFVVTATDNDNTSLVSMATVEVEVVDWNDNTPEFSSRVLLFDASEDAEVGCVLWKVKATDSDSSNNSVISYAILEDSNFFSINSSSGEIQLKQQLDREQRDEHRFVVLAVDGGEPSLTGSVEVVVTVMDVNDCSPKVVNDDLNVNIQEDVEIGHVVVTLVVIDDDLETNAGPFTFDLLPGNVQQEFFIDERGTVKSASKLDSKIRNKYNLTVRIYDNGFPPLSTDAIIIITILPQSNTTLIAHPLEVSVWIPEQDESFLGGVLGKVKVTGSSSRVLYSLQDGWRKFAIDPNDGSIKTLDELRVGTYNLTVSVSDGRTNSQSPVHVVIATIDKEVLKSSVVLRISVPSNRLDLFALRESIASVIGVSGREVLLIGAQEADEPTNEVSESKPRIISRRGVGGEKFFEVLLAVRKPLNDGFFKNSVLKRRLESHKFDIEQRSKVNILEVVANPCSKNSCPRDRDCHPSIRLDADRSVVMTTDGLGVVSVPFKLTHKCQCRRGMTGSSCNEIIPGTFTSPPVLQPLPPPTTSPPTRSDCFGDGCQDNNVMSFSGKSFVSWQLSVAMEKRLNLRLWLRTKHKKGRIMHAVGRKDYSILEIDNGRIQYKFDCGNGLGIARVDTISVSDGRWHAVSVERIDRNVRVTVDYVHSGDGRVPGVNNILNLDSDVVYFGGDINGDEVKDQGFVGCLKEITVDSTPLSIRGSTRVSTMRKIHGVEEGCLEEYFSRAPASGQCSGQCLNGGTCISLKDGSFECRCHPRFSGERCEKSIRPCLSGPCLNGGTCTDLHLNYDCSCPQNFKGRRCESEVNRCGCMNGGRCLHDDDDDDDDDESYDDDDDDDGPICQCPVGFTGHLCEMDVDECPSFPCPPPSTCINLPGGYTCNCSGGILSKTCIPVDHLPAWRITSAEVFIITAILASLLLISLFLVLACKCCLGNQRRKVSSARSSTRGSLEVRPLNARENKVFFYTPKLPYNYDRPLNVMSSSTHQSFQYGASSTSSGSFSTTGEFKTFQDQSTPPMARGSHHHHHHHLPPPIPQRPSYFPLNNTRNLPSSASSGVKFTEAEKVKVNEPKMAVIGELENLLAKGCADRNVCVLKSTAAAIQNRIIDSRPDTKRNDLAILSSGKLTKSPDRNRPPVDFYRLSFDDDNNKQQQYNKQQQQQYNNMGLQINNQSNMIGELENLSNVKGQTKRSSVSSSVIGQRPEGVHTKFLQNNYAVTSSPDKRLKFPANPTSNQQQNPAEEHQRPPNNINNNNINNNIRPQRIEDLYSVPNKQRTNIKHTKEQQNAQQTQQENMNLQQYLQSPSQQQVQQMRLLQQAQQLPQHLRQQLSLFPQKNLPIIHSKAVTKQVEGVEKQSSRVKLEQMSNQKTDKPQPSNRTRENKQTETVLHNENLIRLPPAVPPKPPKNINCLRDTNNQQQQQQLHQQQQHQQHQQHHQHQQHPDDKEEVPLTTDDDDDDCSWKGDESEYVGESGDDIDDDGEETDEVQGNELLIPLWKPEDYSNKVNNNIINNNNLNNNDGNNNNDNNDDNYDEDYPLSVNDSSIDGILSNAVDSQQQDSFDDNTINKFLQDTLQLFRRKKDQTLTPSALPSEKPRSGSRIFGKTGSFRSIFGERRTSRETSVDTEARLGRKLSFGSRNWEAKNWLREKLFGKVSSCSEVESKHDNGTSRDSNLGRFASNELSMSSIRSSSSIDDPIIDLMSNSCISYQSSSNYDNCFSEGGVLSPSPPGDVPPGAVSPESENCGDEVIQDCACLEEILSEVGDDDDEASVRDGDDNDGAKMRRVDGGGCGVGGNPKSLKDNNKRNAMVFDSDDSVNFVDIDGGGDDDVVVE